MPLPTAISVPPVPGLAFARRPVRRARVVHGVDGPDRSLPPPTGTPVARRLVAAAAASLLAVLGLIALVQGTAKADTVADAEKSILLIGVTWEGYVQYPDDSGGLSWSDPVTAGGFCTGWFASEQGHIVTAGHCVDPAEGRLALIERFLSDNGAEELFLVARANWAVEGFDSGSPPRRIVEVVQPPAVEGAVITTPLTAEVVAFQPLLDGDRALLKVNNLNAAIPALPVAPESPAIGDPVTAIGFPASVQAVSDVSRIRASFKSGTVSSSQVNENGVPGTEVNADISPGMSGGPTVNDRGEVLGVNSYLIIGEEQNFNFITDTAALRGFLSQHGVEPASTPAEVAEAPPAPVATTALPATRASGSVPIWVWAAGGIAVVLVGAVALRLVAVSRRRPVAPVTGYPGPAPGPVPMMAPPTPPGAFGGEPQPFPRQPLPEEGPPVPVSAGPATVCPHCRTGNAVHARFCQNCGGSLQSYA